MEGRGTFEIGAGAEGASFAGYDTDAERGFVVEPGPEGVEFDVAGAVDAVELFGAGEGDEEDVGGGEGDFGEGGGGWGGGELGGGHFCRD